MDWKWYKEEAVVKDGSKISGLLTMDQDGKHWKKTRFVVENQVGSALNF